MPSVLKSIDAAIVTLKKLDIFKGAIPSKLFENLAMEVPVLLGVDGEARELFIEQGKCGYYFEPGNTEALCNAIRDLLADPERSRQLGRNGRMFVTKYFNRDNIANGFYGQLSNL
jgi:glycosyltransferase involved in cell wall biosynthesis